MTFVYTVVLASIVSAFVCVLSLMLYIKSNAIKKMLGARTLIIDSGHIIYDAISDKGISIEHILREAQGYGIKDIYDIKKGFITSSGRLVFEGSGDIRKKVDPVTLLPLFYHEQLANAGSYALIDMSGITELNKEFGIVAGDYALVVVAHIIKNRLRNEDAVFRHTKDRFILYMNADEDICSAVVNDIHQKINNLSVYGVEAALSLKYSIVYTPESSNNIINIIHDLESNM